jgi:tRNA 2-thiouridine synthesizing protein A
VTARNHDASRNKMAQTTLDLRGLKCPLPALRTRKALSRLPSDDIVIVECTDPLSNIDIPNLIRETGDHLEDSVHRDDVFIFRIRKR